MSHEFPSIWITLTENNRSISNIAGFYRQWSYKGDTTETTMVKQIKTFINQIESASNKSDKIIITGDANLDANKWDSTNFLHKNVSIEKLPTAMWYKHPSNR